MCSEHFLSLPTWGRGLKHHGTAGANNVSQVAPYMGAWIETYRTPYHARSNSVAPYMGAWIETWVQSNICFLANVSPYMGAWIETCLYLRHLQGRFVVPFIHGIGIETTLNQISTPHTETWIETTTSRQSFAHATVTLYTRA